MTKTTTLQCKVSLSYHEIVSVDIGYIFVSNNNTNHGEDVAYYTNSY